MVKKEKCAYHMQAGGAGEVDRASEALTRTPPLDWWFFKAADVSGSGNSAELTQNPGVCVDTETQQRKDHFPIFRKETSVSI